MHIANAVVVKILLADLLNVLQGEKVVLMKYIVVGCTVHMHVRA